MREGGCSKTLGDALNNVCPRTVKFQHLDSGEFAASGFATDARSHEPRPMRSAHSAKLKVGKGVPSHDYSHVANALLLGRQGIQLLRQSEVTPNFYTSL